MSDDKVQGDPLADHHTRSAYWILRVFWYWQSHSLHRDVLVSYPGRFLA